MHAWLDSKVGVPLKPTGWLFGKTSALIVTVPESVLVKEVLCHAVFWCPHLPQVGHMVTQLFDGFHLLIQVVSLNEVTQLKGRQ